MRLFITISIILGFCFSGLTQNDTINQTDENNLKQGYWIKFDKSKTTKVEEGRFVDDKKDGVWVKYYPSGKVKSEITYIKGKPNGYARFFYENGNVSEEGNWKGNKWTGDYKYYFVNGKPSYEWQYNENGKRTGVQKYYHKNGNLMIEGEWNDGKETGVIKEYYEDGTLKAQKSFNNGKLDESSVKTFPKDNSEITNNDTPKDKSENNNDSNTEDNKEDALKPFDGNGFHKLYKSGRLDREGEFKDSRLINGKRYYYDDNGKLEKINVYRSGRVVDIIYK